MCKYKYRFNDFKTASMRQVVLRDVIVQRVSVYNG